jgi:splicing factor 3A subunit 1
VNYAQIDWHDFVVVEEVLFTEDDESHELPPPTSLNDLQSASLEQKAMMSLQPHNMRIEEAMPEAETYYNPYAPPPVSAVPPSGHDSSPNPPVQHEDEETLAIRERTDARDRAQQARADARGGPTAPMKIRSDYVPRAAAAAASRRGVLTSLCPNCKQQIPDSELAEHMRIELLDPKWKEQRQKAESRYSSSNLSTADVANNLKRLASQRSDVFDAVTGQMIDEEEVKRRKRAENSGYDGMQKEGAKHKGMGGGGGSLEEQIRNIHQKFGNK